MTKPQGTCLCFDPFGRTLTRPAPAVSGALFSFFWRLVFWTDLGMHVEQFSVLGKPSKTHGNQSHERYVFVAFLGAPNSKTPHPNSSITSIVRVSKPFSLGLPPKGGSCLNGNQMGQLLIWGNAVAPEASTLSAPAEPSSAPNAI